MRFKDFFLSKGPKQNLIENVANSGLKRLFLRSHSPFVDYSNSDFKQSYE